MIWCRQSRKFFCLVVSKLIFDTIGKRLLPIEVKSGETVRSNSLLTLLQNTPGLQAVRYSVRPYKEQNALIKEEKLDFYEMRNIYLEIKTRLSYGKIYKTNF